MARQKHCPICDRLGVLDGSNKFCCGWGHELIRWYDVDPHTGLKQLLIVAAITGIVTTGLSIVLGLALAQASFVMTVAIIMLLYIVEDANRIPLNDPPEDHTVADPS